MNRAAALASLLVAGCVSAQLPPEVTDTVEGTPETMVSVLVPAKEGSEAYYMTKTEIPWDVFDVFVYRLDLIKADKSDADAEGRPSKPYYLPDEGFGHKAHPALAMTHSNAEAFAEWLSDNTGHHYRLPTEAEWEHACAGGNAEPPKPIANYAWHWDNAFDKTGPVGDLEANGYGLHDMLGNVAEFVIDADGGAVIKGGSYRTAATELSCQWRQSYKPSWNATDPQFPKSQWWYADGSFLGFRLIREVDAD